MSLIVSIESSNTGGSNGICVVACGGGGPFGGAHGVWNLGIIFGEGGSSSLGGRPFGGGVSLETALVVDQSLEEGEEVVVEEVLKSEAEDVAIVKPSPSSAVEPVVSPSAQRQVVD